MRVLKALIIDDERNNREYLKELINIHCEGIEVCATADSALNGIKAINMHHPDVVFLDIEMPGGSGFDFLEGVDNHNFQLIFVTAYSQYAIQAIKSQAIDYLLKPVDLSELRKAIQVLHKKKFTINSGKNSKLSFSLADKIIYINPQEIVCVCGEGNYCTFYLINKKSFIISKHLKAIYEMLLPEGCFIRIHNSHLVNLNHVEQLLKKDGDFVLTRNNHQLPLSRRKKEEFLEAMKEHSSNT